MYGTMVQSRRGPTRAAGSTTVLACSLLAGACAPTFSELQSAKLAGPGRLEVTPSYSVTHFADDGESDKVQDHYGVQLATGVDSRVDVRVRYERIVVDDEGVNVIGAGPKVELSQDQFAVYVPFGFAFGNGIDTRETFQMHPTVIGTATLSPQAEVTLAGKALIPFDQGTDHTLAVNLGLGFGDLERWVIRPETGVLINPGESGVLWHLSVGFTGYLGGSQRSADQIAPAPPR